jgi:hypothetical protein
MPARVLLPSDKLAGTKEFKITQNEAIPPTLFVTGLDGSEVVTINISPDDGATQQEVFQGGVSAALTATNNSYAVVGQGTYQVSKDAGTTNNVGVFLAKGAQI